MLSEENIDGIPEERKPETPEITEVSEKAQEIKPAEESATEKTEKAKKPEEKPVENAEEKKANPESGRFEKRRPDRKRVDRRGFRQGIRREEYRNKPYDALPARDQNIHEILNTGNSDVINRTAEDYGKTWGDRPPWVKNRFSTFQIRPIIAKVHKLKNREFESETVNELKLLKPLVAYIARRYHDDDLYEFARIVRYSIDEVGDNPKKFKHFYSFFESLLLYFRANGGK